MEAQIFSVFSPSVPLEAPSLGLVAVPPPTELKVKGFQPATFGILAKLDSANQNTLWRDYEFVSVSTVTTILSTDEEQCKVHVLSPRDQTEQNNDRDADNQSFLGRSPGEHD